MRLLASSLLGSLMILTACGNNTTEPAKPDPPRIEISLAVNAATFSTTEPLIVEVTAANTGGQTLDLGYGSSGCWLGLTAHRDGKRVDVGISFVCPADYRHKTLEPGDVRTETIYLDGVLYGSSPYRTIQLGTYQFVGTLQDHRSEPLEIEFLGGPLPKLP